MPSTRNSADSSDVSSFEAEKESFLNNNPLLKRTKNSWFYSKAHIISLYITNAVTLIMMTAMIARLARKSFDDPSLGIYSPANGAVEYIKEYKFRSALFDPSPYMGFPNDEIDKRWEDLYNFGISKISKSEADKLVHPTIKIRGTDEYLVQLDVWHELHCLNDLRMLLYPERFPGLAAVTNENGTIDRTTIAFRHWDHCIDSIREAIMCHADVAPIPFRVNVPANKVIVPRLSTTHTCRNFTKIQEWAKENTAGVWNYNVTAEQAEEVIRESGFDNGPWENIEDQYDKFPGNKYFKYWRDHPEEAAAALEKSKEEKAAEEAKEAIGTMKKSGHHH